MNWISAVLVLAWLCVSQPAQANSSLRICNQGELPLNYGRAEQLMSPDEDGAGGAYRFSWYRTIDPGECKVAHTGYTNNTFFFMVEHPEDGGAYNPVYRPRKSKRGDDHIERICVPRNMTSFYAYYRSEIIHKMKTRCPKHWTAIETSFTTAFTPGWGRAALVGQTLTVNIAPKADNLGRRLW